jgi:hypothetical protein
LKYAPLFGVLCALLLVFFSFQPWAYYPDIREIFTGFYSRENTYGRPGRTFIFFASLAVLFFLIPRFWAKRANLMVGVLTLVFAIKAYVLFSSCYHGYCPEKKPALYGMLICGAGVLLSALLSGAKEDRRTGSTN